MPDTWRSPAEGAGWLQGIEFLTTGRIRLPVPEPDRASVNPSYESRTLRRTEAGLGQGRRIRDVSERHGAALY
jgi:hypothetical protein